MEDCDLNEKKFKIALLKKNSTRHKKTQKGSSMSSGIKSMHKRGTSLKRLKL